MRDLAKMRRGACRSPLSTRACFVSPLLRARQTAEALGLADPILDPRLMEQNWGAGKG